MLLVNRRIKTAMLGVTLAVLAAPAIFAGVPNPELPRPGGGVKRLKVFILAGQSNMQGHAKVSTFGSMADDPKTAPLLREMLGPDGKPKVCDRV
jgi:hypothetical protein